jgi:hypothetical protein
MCQNWENVSKLGKCVKTGKMCQNWENVPKLGKCVKTGKMCQNWENEPKLGYFSSLWVKMEVCQNLHTL